LVYKRDGTIELRNPTSTMYGWLAGDSCFAEQDSGWGQGIDGQAGWTVGAYLLTRGKIRNARTDS